MPIYLTILLLIDRVLIGACWSVFKLDEGTHGRLDQPIVYWVIGSLLIGLAACGVQNYRLIQAARRRQQAEAGLKASEAHHRALIQAIPDLIMRLNRDGVFLEFLASPNFPVLGPLLSDWVGTHVADKLPSNIAQKRLEAIQTALETQSIQVYEQDLSIDGSLQMEQVRVVPYSDDEVLVLVQDISDRKQAEARLQTSEQRFRRAIAMAPLPIMLHAEDGEVLHINSTWTELTGYTQQDIPTTRAWAQRAYGERANTMLKTIIAKSYSLESRHDEGDLVVTARNGCQRIWECSSSALEKLPDGRRVAISMAVDVTQRRQTEMALRESEERYRSIYNQAAVGLANGTIDGKFVDVNPRFCEMLGYSREELLAKSIKEITHPDDQIQSKIVTQNLFANETPYVFHKKRYLRKDGSFFWCSTGMSIVRDTHGNPKHTLSVMRDISERVQAEEQLKYDAFHDELTGLPNRSLLMNRLELALKRTKRHPETQLAVLFIDLDNFKVINDSLGHLVGDQLLLVISNRLKLLIRETDLAARLGGDEFVVLLEDINDLSEAVMVAERILDMLQSPLNIAERELFPSASVGIVTSGINRHHQAADLLRDADVAMYWAKQSGRSQYAIFNPAMHLQAVQRLKIENHLRKALDNNEFLLYYQPIVNLNTQTIEAFEALIRWQHPQEGLLTPDQFVEIAEETGLISAIGKWLLYTACQQLAIWQAQFPKTSIGININLSGQQLEESLVLELKDILATHQLQDNSLMLEITESMLVQTVETTQSLLNRLRAIGVRIAIDDFGIGYSCLRYLHQLPVDALKINRSFISLAISNNRNQMITESIITLANSLGLTAIVEGIETAQQLNWLKKIDCDIGQGNYFAGPMTEAQATELLRQETNSASKSDSQGDRMN